MLMKYRDLMTHVLRGESNFKKIEESKLWLAMASVVCNGIVALKSKPTDKKVN